MKLFSLSLIFLIALAGTGFAQIPATVTTARWDIPNTSALITGATLTARYKVPKQVWFAEFSPGRIGTMVFPKECQATTATEYYLPSLMPYRITYAEKMVTVADTGTKPPKYKPQVWFINFNGTIFNPYPGAPHVIYGLAPAAKKSTTGTLITYPVSGGSIDAGLPMDIQWVPAAAKFPAKIWFSSFFMPQSAPPTQNLYTLEPKAKGTAPLEAVLTQYIMPALHLITAFKVEYGFVWAVAVDLNSSGAQYLYLFPVTGGSGVRWPLAGSTFNPSWPPSIQPLYTKTKPKVGVLPDQVWISNVTSVTVFTLTPSLSATATDLACTMITPAPVNATSHLTGMLSANAKADSGKKMIGVRNDIAGGGTSGGSLVFMKASPATSVARTAVTISIATVVVHGSAQTVQTGTMPMPATCGTVPALAQQPGQCFNAQWDASLGIIPLGVLGNLPAMTDMLGMSEAKKFDLVFPTSGGPMQVQGTSVPSIFRAKGIYAKQTSTLAPFAADESFDDENETESIEPMEFSLNDAYPNPCNPSATIRFTLPEPSVVTLTVYSMLGQEVQRIVDSEELAEGAHEYQFNGANLASGIYVYRLQTNSYTAVKKLMLMK